jgi:capsid protein
MARGRRSTVSTSKSKRTPVTAAVVTNGGHYPFTNGSGTTLFRRSDDSQYRKHRPGCLQDIAHHIPQYHQRKLISDARYIYTSSGMVAGAIHKKADYVVGEAWRPQYRGADKQFKALAEPIVRSWASRCEMRGGPFNLTTNLWLTCVALDRDGDAFCVLTEDPDTGEPRLQFIEAHRIASLQAETKVDRGVYKGLTILNGVVYDRYTRPVAYNLLPPTREEPKDYNFLPAESVIHLFDPRWFSQGRGIPSISYGILSWYDIDEILDAEKIAVKVNSKLSIIEKNETGTSNATAAAMMLKARAGYGKTPPQPSLAVEELAEGTIRYIKSGNSLESHKSDRPSTTFQGFIEHCARGAFLGMDWPIEVGFDMSSLGGASVRAVVHQAQRSVSSRQSRIEPFALNMLLHGVAGLMNRNQIPFTEDWMLWDFNRPAKFSVDVGRDRQNARMDLACGLTTLEDEVTESGGDLEEHLTSRASTLQLAQRIATEFGVPIEGVYNPTAFAVQAPEPKEETGDDEEDDVQEEDEGPPTRRRNGGAE